MAELIIPLQGQYLREMQKLCPVYSRCLRDTMCLYLGHRRHSTEDATTMLGTQKVLNKYITNSILIQHSTQAHSDDLLVPNLQRVKLPALPGQALSISLSY